MARHGQNSKEIWEGDALSRRQFVGSTVALAGLVVSSAIGWPETATAAVSPGTAFPTTPVLDSFTRPNAPTLGPNWLGAQEGHKQLAIFSDQAKSADPAEWDTGAAIWAPGGSIAKVGPDCEVYCTITKTAGRTLMCTTLYARVQGSALASTLSAYFLQIRSDGKQRLYYCLNGREPLTHVFPLSRWLEQKTSAGDKWGLSCVGSTIKAWYGPQGVWQGTPIVSATDTHLPAAGGIMFSVGGTGCLIDDFGGGTRP